MLIPVEARAPVKGLSDTRAFEIESGVVFIGHADPAVRLDHLVRRLVQCLARARRREARILGDIP